MLVTVGSFDGFHKGHEKLFEVCRENSRNNGWGVVTFSPHPAKFMGRLKNSLFTLKERGFLAKIFDVPEFLVFNFDSAFKNLTPEEFIDVLIKNFDVDGIVSGSDFHFGRNNTGSADTLEKVYRDKIKIFKLNLFDKEFYSSSKAREEIILGDVDGVKKILGYPFFMISGIIHGCGRGHTMNFPTANINLNDRIIPADGVYSTAVFIDGSFHCGALSIGTNPTFHDIHETRAEVFITDFHGDIYGSELLIFFLGRLRGIKTFENREALMTQINNDIKTCREIFNSSMQDPDTKKFLEHAGKIFSTQKNFNPEIIDIKSCL